MQVNEALALDAERIATDAAALELLHEEQRSLRADADALSRAHGFAVGVDDQ